MKQTAILKNYLKIAARNLVNYKAYSFINVSGLATGMACSFLILLFVKDEINYDRHHKNASRIYRLVTTNINSPELGYTLTPTEIAGGIIKESPSLLTGTRIHPAGGLVCYRGRCFNEDRFFFADSTVFAVFTFEFIAGNPQTALLQPHSVVITEEMARKYFGAEESIGKVITFDDSLFLEITGIIKNIPHNTHLKFDFLASLANIEKSTYSVLTYLLFKNSAWCDEFEKNLPKLFKKYSPGFNFGDFWRPALQPLTNVHFHSHLEWEIEPNSQIVYIYIFSVVAVFVLLLACINFVNLATARSTQRAKEVGVRKVVGASRKQLATQFIGESILLSLIALGFAMVLVECALPFFNDLVDKALVLRYNEDLLLLIGIAILVGFVAGSYPAFFLTRFQPAQVLKGKFHLGRAGYALRKGLVVAQFTISIVLIIATAVIFNQLEFVRTKNLGITEDAVVITVIRDKEAQRRYQTFKNSIIPHPNVLKAAASSTVPGRTLETSLPKMLYILPGEEDTQTPDKDMVNTVWVDEDFLETFEIDLVAGRTFSKNFSTDVAGGFILNEAAAKKFGWKSPQEAIAKEVKYWQRGYKSAQIIGIVKDFNYISLHSNIDPLIIRLLDPQNPLYPVFVHAPGVLSIRVGPNNISDTIERIAKKWKEIDSNHPFEYFFLDENLDKLYQADQRLGQIFGYFSVLAIFIACLGMFGLASFTAEQRTKEIGMRKVLGASVSQIILLVSKDFTKPVTAAFIVAVPIAYLVMNRWLQDFAYRIDISVWTFILVGLLALLIALVTVSYHSIKTAFTNPVNVLRYE